MTLQEKVIKILMDVTGNLDITVDSKLDEVLIDSLDEAEFVFELEDRLNFDYEQHDDCDTVKELIELIEKET